MKKFDCTYCGNEVTQIEAIFDVMAKAFYCPYCGYPTLKRRRKGINELRDEFKAWADDVLSSSMFGGEA